MICKDGRWSRMARPKAGRITAMNKTMKAADPTSDFSSTAWTNGKNVGSVYTVTVKPHLGSVNEFKVTDTVQADKSHLIVLQVYNTATLALSRAFVQVDINV